MAKSFFSRFTRPVKTAPRAQELSPASRPSASGKQKFGKRDHVKASKPKKSR
jgi:hypothetical protein